MDAVPSMFHGALSQKRDSEKKQSIIPEHIGCIPELKPAKQQTPLTMVELCIWNLRWIN